MKNYFVLCLMLPVFGLTQTAQEMNSPEDCITSFFKAFHAQDTNAMKMFIHDDLIMTTINSNDQDTLLVVQDVHEFYSSIASIRESVAFHEELTEVEVKSDGLIAHVWTPYKFLLNNEVSHKGVNAFTLLKDGESWKIIYLVDTRR